VVNAPAGAAFAFAAHARAPPFRRAAARLVFFRQREPIPNPEHSSISGHNVKQVPPVYAKDALLSLGQMSFVSAAASQRTLGDQDRNQTAPTRQESGRRIRYTHRCC